jgi:hypothetical protein
MTALATAPKIVKKYRLHSRRADGAASYICVDADGEDLMTVHADGSISHHIIGGHCSDCAYRLECTWPECPNRFPKPGIGWVQGQWRGHDGEIPPKMWIDGRYAPTVWVDGQYIPVDGQSSASNPPVDVESVESTPTRVIPGPVSPVQEPRSEPEPLKSYSA